jgi:3-oxoadipate enol-lactonase
VIDEYVPAAWGRQCYRRSGSGPPLLMLHSLALSGRMWEPVLGAMAASHDVISVDFRGHGGSDWDGRQFAVEDLAADLRALLDALAIERCHVLGVSMGGSVAAVFAASFPDRTGRLVLADTTAWYGPGTAAMWAERAETAARTTRERQVPFQTDRWFSEHFRRTHPATVSHVVGIFLRTAPRAHAAACLALGDLDARDRLGTIRAPALVVTGEEDYATPPAMGKELADGISGATFHVWPGLRHFSVLESGALRQQALTHLGGGHPAPAGAGEACCGTDQR